MSKQFEFDANGLAEKIEKLNYSYLNDTLREALSKSLDILYNRSKQSLASTGWNISGNVSKYRKGQRTYYNSLSDGIIKEISTDATKGRVRIAPMKTRGYLPNTNTCFVLPWVENGTEERFRKGTTGKRRKTVVDSATGKKKRIGTGSSTGSLKPTSFFEKARESSREQMTATLEQNIHNAIQKIWNS